MSQTMNTCPCLDVGNILFILTISTALANGSSSKKKMPLPPDPVCGFLHGNMFAALFHAAPQEDISCGVHRNLTLRDALNNTGRVPVTLRRVDTKLARSTGLGRSARIKGNTAPRAAKPTRQLHTTSCIFILHQQM